MTSPQTLDAIAKKRIFIWQESDVQTIYSRVKNDPIQLSYIAALDVVLSQ